MSPAAEECLRVQLLTAGLAAAHGSVLNTRGPQAWPSAASPGAVIGNRNWMVTAVTPKTGKHKKAETSGPGKTSLLLFFCKQVAMVPNAAPNRQNLPPFLKDHHVRAIGRLGDLAGLSFGWPRVALASLPNNAQGNIVTKLQRPSQISMMPSGVKVGSAFSWSLLWGLPSTLPPHVRASRTR